MRKFICAANWKLNKNPKEAGEFFKSFMASTNSDEQAHFIIFPPAINLVGAAEYFPGTAVGWGAQNVYSEAHGAFTGENSAAVVAWLGATHCLVGHSERRQVFTEDDQLLAKKFRLIQDQNMVPMLCVGETLAERELNKTNDVIGEQLRAGLEILDRSKEFIVAYEPVWAIGTGHVATPEQAEAAHAYLRETLMSLLDETAADKVSILYGGSVKPENAAELSQQANIDGFLIGGASLKPESFIAILRNSNY